MNNEEVWRDIFGYTGLYQVSNLGRVKSLPRRGTIGGILKPCLKEYLMVCLSKGNKKKSYDIHRYE